MNSSPHQAQPLQQAEFETARLMAEFPPVWLHSNKQLVFNIACPSGAVHSGALRYTRWAVMPLPESIRGNPSTSLVVARKGFYDYQPVSTSPDIMEWHVNFADPHLFAACSSGLFAQDEMQVAEHPALGALREALDARGLPALTVQQGQPTPVLISGVERRCHVATDANPTEGRPNGLYGKRFAAARPAAIRHATRRIEPPTISNLIAMSALPGGRDFYTADQIRFTLDTAYSGFCAAVLESARTPHPAPGAVVHTGFWGCGAFGGNRELMALLQILAATAAGLQQLVFHTGDDAGPSDLANAQDQLCLIFGGAPEMPTALLVARLAERAYDWKTSDGN